MPYILCQATHVQHHRSLTELQTDWTRLTLCTLMVCRQTLSHTLAKATQSTSVFQHITTNSVIALKSSPGHEYSLALLQCTAWSQHLTIPAGHVLLLGAA